MSTCLHPLGTKLETLRNSLAASASWQDHIGVGTGIFNADNRIHLVSAADIVQDKNGMRTLGEAPRPRIILDPAENTKEAVSIGHLTCMNYEIVASFEFIVPDEFAGEAGLAILWAIKLSETIICEAKEKGAIGGENVSGVDVQYGDFNTVSFGGAGLLDPDGTNSEENVQFRLQAAVIWQIASELSVTG